MAESCLSKFCSRCENFRKKKVLLVEDNAGWHRSKKVEKIEAGRYLDTVHQLAVVNASNISQQEYLSRQASDYLEPEEIVECEKYRLQRDYGMAVTEELVRKEEICATDSDVKKMAEAASASRVHLKAILNLTIPENCNPMWLVGVLIGQLGLKTVSSKKGKRGEQVRYYSLAKEDTIFAVEVLQHRIKQREEKAKRELERQGKNLEHQAMMQMQYGI